jgi:excisionase family DNA binding protein
MSRSKTYELLAAGELRGVKSGRTVLIDVKYGLEYLRALPAVKIRPRAKPRRRSKPAEDRDCEELRQTGPPSAEPARTQSRVKQSAKRVTSE